jgi:hypothetical protein
MTTTTASQAPAQARQAEAAWTAFGKFALVFGIAFVVTYVVCAFAGWPLFTFHPATNRLAWGYEAARRGEGPAMYWYGWTVNCLIVGGVAGLLATLLPASVVRRIPLALTWLLLLAGFPLMLYFMLPILTK